MLNAAILSYNLNKITQFSAQITPILNTFSGRFETCYGSISLSLVPFSAAAMKCQQVNEIVHFVQVYLVE